MIKSKDDEYVFALLKREDFTPRTQIEGMGMRVREEAFAAASRPSALGPSAAVRFVTFGLSSELRACGKGADMVRVACPISYFFYKKRNYPSY